MRVRQDLMRRHERMSPLGMCMAHPPSLPRVRACLQPAALQLLCRIVGFRKLHLQACLTDVGVNLAKLRNPKWVAAGQLPRLCTPAGAAGRCWQGWVW